MQCKRKRNECLQLSQVVHDDSEAPDVTHLGVLVSARDDLWGHVVGSATALVHGVLQL